MFDKNPLNATADKDVSIMIVYVYVPTQQLFYTGKTLITFGHFNKLSLTNYSW